MVSVLPREGVGFFFCFLWGRPLRAQRLKNFSISVRDSTCQASFNFISSDPPTRPYFLWGTQKVKIENFKRDCNFRARLIKSSKIEYSSIFGPWGYFGGSQKCCDPVEVAQGRKMGNSRKVLAGVLAQALARMGVLAGVLVQVLASCFVSFSANMQPTLTKLMPNSDISSQIPLPIFSRKPPALTSINRRKSTINVC